MTITKQTVADQIAAYLRHDISLTEWSGGRKRRRWRQNSQSKTQAPLPTRWHD